MGNGGFHLSSKTPCAICGEKIKRGRDSYGCPASLKGAPAHFRCIYPPATTEMATTTGADE